MKQLSFLFQYIVNPRDIGAVLPSSKFLANKMVENIDFHKAKFIVEYGPGTGVFTEILLQRRNPRTTMMLIENNQEFYLLLKEKYKMEKNLYIINGSAEKIEQYVRDYKIPYVDYVISGLPFASLPKKVSHNILLNTKKILDKDGQFITFQYTRSKKAFIEQFFGKIEVKRELRNVPPAFVFNCSVHEKNVEETYAVQNSYC